MTKALAAAAAILTAFPLLLILLVTASTGAPAQAAPAAAGLAGTPTALAISGIPADYLAWYLAAAKTCPGLPWSVLAGIGEAESGHGRSSLPGVRSGSNSAGAEGPMQLEPSAFGQFAVNADPGQPLSPYDPADAIYTAAAVLCASGARGGTPAGLRNAVFAYNHASWYVSEVMAWAAKYATQGGGYAAVTAIVFAMAQLGKPYQWGAAGPGAYDCSGLVYAAYAAAGIRIARTTYQWQH
ncbi:MAG TPA: NlpC/P60 family protein, partial [Streptosporangiaceae bacterium]